MNFSFFKQNRVKCTSIDDVMKYVEKDISAMQISSMMANQVRNISKATMTKVFNNLNPDYIEVRSNILLDTTSITFRFRGSVQGILSESKALKIRYYNGFTELTLYIKHSYNKISKAIALSLLAGLVVGIIMEFLIPEATADILLTKGLLPIDTIIIKILSLVATPVTFLCIVYNVADFSSLIYRYPNISKLGIRYITTSLISVILGIAVFICTKPLLITQPYQYMEIEESNMETSLSAVWNNITDIVPQNIFSPFTDSKIIQVLFLAFIMGLAIGLVDREYGKAIEATKLIREVFCKMITLLFECGPFIVFMFSISIILNDGIEFILMDLVIFLMIVIGLVILVVFYSLTLKANGFSPIEFAKDMKDTLLNVFNLGSGIDAVPTTIRNCADKMHLPRKPMGIAISFGASFNMDAICITESIIFLIAIYSYNVELSTLELALCFLTILAASFGSPNLPGTITIASNAVFLQAGLDTSLLVFVLLIEVLLNRILSVMNVAGDIVCAKIVGEKERKAMQKL